MKYLLTLAVTLIIATFLPAQNQVFTFQNDDTVTIPDEMRRNYSEHKVYSYDLTQIKKHLQNKNSSVVFDFENWEMIDAELTPSYILSPNFKVSTLNENGKKDYQTDYDIVTLKGYTSSGELRLTINDNYINGYLKTEQGTHFIETVSTRGKMTSFSIVNEKNRTEKIQKTCNHHNHFDVRDTPEPLETRIAGQCYQVAVVSAADFLMVQKHGGIDETVNHIISVLNNVQSNYDYEGNTNFENGLQLNLEEVSLSTCEKCDPWTESTNFFDVFSSYSNWAKESKYATNHHIGQFWTGRDFNGNYVGLAGYDSKKLCNHSRHHILQDFTNDAAALKTLVAHELGHNFGAKDLYTPGSIMSGQLYVTDNWDADAKTSINNEIQYQKNCLNYCGSNLCDPVTGLEIKNITTNSFELHWNALPTDRFKVLVTNSVTGEVIYAAITKGDFLLLKPRNYDICQRYEVQMIRECSSWQSDKFNLFFSSPVGQGCADFEMSTSVFWEEDDVSVIDKSIHTNSWDWDFGDGNFLSGQNPVHSYDEAGLYDIVLSINNGIHEKQLDNSVQILPVLNIPYTRNIGGNYSSTDLQWAAESEDGPSLWERGIPNGKLSQNNDAWKTLLTSNISRTASKSYLYSPKFNFENINEYILKFDLSMDAPICSSPFALQLQYTTDDGATWQRLGSHGDSGNNIQNWYNKGKWSSCGVHKTQFYDQNGWILQGNNVPVSYDLSFLGGQSKVAFRFAFIVTEGNNISTGYDGVMIDNFEILTNDLIISTGSIIEEGVHDVAIDTDIVEDLDNRAFSIYPNPNYGEILNISSESMDKYDSVQIYNAMGQLMINTAFSSQINIKSLPQGTYFVRCISKDQIIQTKKLQVLN